MAAGKLAITAPYADITTGQLIITIARPFSRGNTDGVIAGDVSIDGLVKDVLAMNSEGTYAILVDSNGTIIAPGQGSDPQTRHRHLPGTDGSQGQQAGPRQHHLEMDISGKASVFDLTGSPTPTGISASWWTKRSPTSPSPAWSPPPSFRDC